MTDSTPITVSRRDLPIEAGGEVQITLSSNRLRLRGTDGERVVVRSSGGDDIEDQVVLESAPGRVVIRDSERGFRFGPVRMRVGGSQDLDIDVPRSARVSLKTLSGDVDAVGISGDSRWASASGDLRIQVDGGRLAIESMSGDVTVEATAAIDLRARTVSGDLQVRAPRLDTVDASTTSGDVRVEGELGAAVDHRISSVSGDVELVTPSPVRVETQTITGDVRASGAHTAEGGRGRRTIVAGAGSVQVSVRTTSGDIRLRTSGSGGAAHGPLAANAPAGAPVAPSAPEAPIAPIPPVEPQVPDAPEAPAPLTVVAEAEAAPNLVRPTVDATLGADSAVDRREAARLEVLRALERGELDIEAASRRLEQLEDAGPRYFRGWC
jgi:hypothetical protein